MRAPPRRVLLAAQVVAAALLLFFIGRELVRQWTAFQSQPLEARLSLADVVVSGTIVLGTYALLVQTWRILLAGADESLPFWRAARIWSISNLWRYVPGKLWQIGVMAGLAHREHVSAVAAAGSAVLSTVMNIATGLAIVLLLGGRWLQEWDAAARPVAIGLVVLAVTGLMSLPYVLPRLSALAARLSGRDVQLKAPRTAALVLAILGNVLSWLLYGVAFFFLVRGVLGDAAGAPWQYIAVFTASYVVGYLFLVIPGGIGPREAVMVSLMTALSLATPKQAWLVAATSRVWLTILELAPGLLFLAYDRSRRRTSNTLPTDVPTE